MTQLIRASFDLAKFEGASRSEINILKDCSFTYRELAPLFEILREARNYFAHNTTDEPTLVGMDWLAHFSESWSVQIFLIKSA